MSSESLLSQHSEQEDVDLEHNSILRRMEARLEHEKVKTYKAVYAFSTSSGIGILALLLVWILHYRGGFSWQSNPSQQFYWHPILMFSGLVFIYSQSMLVYRTFPNASKKTLKLIHTILHFFEFILSIIGLKSAFDSHNLAEPPKPNLFSLHSWIGLITVIFFAFQFFSGFITFLYPGLSKSFRKCVLPFHVILGISIFTGAIAATITGLTEKAIWTLAANYGKYPSEGILFNFIGFFVLIYGISVLYLINNDYFKRVALPEEELTLTDGN